MPKTTKQLLALLRNGNIGIPLVILCILAMVILPLPPALLDILFTFNIVLAVMVLLVAFPRNARSNSACSRLFC